MALLKYIILVTLLAPNVKANAVTDCSSNSALCTGTGAIGSICETLSDGSGMECNCNTGFVRVGDTCIANVVSGCSVDGDCSASPFGGTCTATNCNCASGYELVGTNCKVKPAVPTLSVTDGTSLNSLISGTSYTLQCASTGAPGDIPYTYTFAMGGSSVAAALGAVTEAANGGSYTCTAAYDGVTTDSVAATITVKPAKPTLTEQGGTPLTDLSVGADYTLVCTSANAPSGTTYAFSKGGSSTSETLTSVSVAGTDGSYTCTATASSVNSDVSDTVVVGVGAAGKYCSSTSDCSGDSFSGTCTANRCVCATGYQAIRAECSVIPTKPTLTEQGGAPLGDLSEGGSYTLICTSANAPSGTTYAFTKGGASTSATLSSVTTVGTAGSYACTATANGVSSEASDAVTVTVGAVGKYCAGSSDCSGTSFSGTCTTNRCVCATGYTASGTLCSASGLTCSVDGDCTGAQYSGTCSSNACDCASSYTKSTTGCETQPTKPTLTLDGNPVESDLSSGGSYTLVCSSSGAASGTTYTYYQGTTLLSGTSLSSVSSTNDGSYTCYAITSTGASSVASDALNVVIGVSGKYCTSNSDCTAGNGLTGTCTTNRCVCSSGYQAAGTTCSSAVQTATISMFSILLAFAVFKLL